MTIDLETPLTDDELKQAVDLGTRVPSRTTDELMPLPIPSDEAPSFSFNGRDATSVWSYFNDQGQLEGYVCRFDTAIPGGKPRKDIRPLRYGLLNGTAGWYWKGWGLNRPLYGLPMLLDRPDAVVIVTEGEKAADAAAKLFPDMVAVTSMNGAKAPAMTNWTPLAGRRVVIATDHDNPGRDYGSTVCKLVREAGAREVLYLAPDRLGRYVWHDGQRMPRDGALPEGWDLADALAEGWTAETVAQQQSEPGFFTPVEASELIMAAGMVAMESPYFRLKEDGVYRRTDSNKGEVSWDWLCSRLEVVAETRDADGHNWGRLLRVTDRDGRSKEWAMPMSLLAGDGTAMRERLLSMGLDLAHGNTAKEALSRFISTARPTEKARCVSRIGWHGSRFVLPDLTIGDTTGERVLLQGTGSSDHAFRQSGTLESWQREVARYAVGNSRLTLSVSAAFAPMLLYLLDAESGGLHLRGPSSIGKSTSLVVAGSVWGGGGVKGYTKQWRATDNGLEALAVNHSDALLCLDELSQIDAKSAAAAAYMLANGAGKARAGRSGEGRAAAEWRTFFLSNGEIGIADKLAEDGRGRRAAAGQQVRVVDISADAGAGLGLFESLHGFDTADSFAKHIKAAAAQHYGTAAPAFIAKLIANKDEVMPTLREAIKRFVGEYCPPGADGQVSRVAARFGMVAAAGELAAAWGILPWSGGEAAAGVARCFDAWLRGRGGIGAAEAREVTARVRHFLELHGSARFELMGRDTLGMAGEVQDIRIANRAGFRRMETSGNKRWEYLILPAVFWADVCTGIDKKLAIKVLIEQGFLIPDKDGKPQSRHNLPGLGTTRVYRISGRILEGEDDA